MARKSIPHPDWPAPPVERKIPGIKQRPATARLRKLKVGLFDPSNGELLKIVELPDPRTAFACEFNRRRNLNTTPVARIIEDVPAPRQRKIDDTPIGRIIAKARAAKRKEVANG